MLRFYSSHICCTLKMLYTIPWSVIPDPCRVTAVLMRVIIRGQHRGCAVADISPHFILYKTEYF